MIAWQLFHGSQIVQWSGGPLRRHLRAGAEPIGMKRVRRRRALVCGIVDGVKLPVAAACAASRSCAHRMWRRVGAERDHVSLRNARQ